MDMDVALGMGPGHVLGQDMVVNEGLGRFGPVFQHHAHGRIAVDIGVLPLQVRLGCIGKGDVLEGFHEGILFAALAGPLRPVENIGLGCQTDIVFHQDDFHQVLDFLHCRFTVGLQTADDVGCQLVQLGVGQGFTGNGGIGLGYGLPDLVIIEGDQCAVSFDYLPGAGDIADIGFHKKSPFSDKKRVRQYRPPAFCHSP